MITGYIDITDERGMPERISIQELYEVFKIRLLKETTMERWPGYNETTVERWPNLDCQSPTDEKGKTDAT